MKRNKQTPLQKQRSSGIVGVKRAKEGHWDRIYNTKFGYMLKNYPLQSIGRWCKPYKESIRDVFLERRRYRGCMWMMRWI